MASALSQRQFHNEDAAFAWVESRLWPNGPVCPFCKATGEKIGRLEGKTTRPGLRKCYACRKPFTVRVGTIFESSHAPLRYWLQAIYLICSSKKGISTRQLQRTLGCGLKTAWFLSHRIREAMAPAKGSDPIGGAGKTVEADEMFIGTRKGVKKHPGSGGAGHKMAVLSLVERGGRTVSFKLPGNPNAYDIKARLFHHVDPETRLVTDKAQYYKGTEFKHESVDHSAKEFVRGDVHTNTVEGYFSVFKRGMFGTYQHCGEQHLQRYLAEFDFRQNTRTKLGYTDAMRADEALQGVKGKRLTYKAVV